MAKLTKSIFTTYIPGDPGSPGSPGIPPSPGYWKTVCTETSGGCVTQLTPIYTPCAAGAGGPYSLVLGNSTCISGWTTTTQCVDATTICSSVYVPATAGVPAVPARSPTPGQIIQNFNEGWNASAQSYTGLLPGKAVLFKVGTGSRGVLTGFAVEQWTPKISTLPFGILFYDGQASVYENNVLKEPLGYFYNSQEFIIGRSMDNYVVYMNKTTGQLIARRQVPAPATVPIHFFALQYRGGDVVLT